MLVNVAYTIPFYYAFATSLVLVLVALLLGHVIHHNILNPLTLMGVSWLLPPLTTYYSEEWLLSPSTWLIIYLSFLSYILGYFLGLLLVGQKRLSIFRGKTISGLSKKGFLWSKSKSLRVMYFMFLVGTMGFAINIGRIIKAGGLRLYLTEGLRTAELIFGANPIINQLYFLIIGAFAFAVLYLAVYGFRFRVFVIALVSFLMLFPQGTKGNIIRSLLLGMYLYLLAVRKFNWKWVLLVIVGTYISFMFVTIGRDPRSYGSKSFIEIQRSVVKTIYLYVAPNYKNLEMEIENRREFLLGKETLSSLIKVITLDGTLVKTHLLDRPKYYLKDEAYRVGTYLRDWYIDFGLPGIFIGSLLTGMISGSIVSMLILKFSMRWYFIYAVLLTMTSFAWWFNSFKNVQLWFISLTVYLIDIARLKPAKSEHDPPAQPR